MSRHTEGGTIYRSRRGAPAWNGTSILIALAMFAPYMLIAPVVFTWVMWA